MYLSLIDAVDKIVATYGVDILTGPKFWYILSDVYSFGSEYTLKEVVKRCVDAGYVTGLVVLKGDTGKTEKEISRIVEAEGKAHPGKKKEYAAVLYSVAIAIGSCSKADYEDFLRGGRTHNSGNNNPVSGGNDKSSWLLAFLIVALGLLH